MTENQSSSLTAPTLLGLSTRGAVVMAAALMAALVLSATADLRAVQSPVLFGLALGVSVSGVVGMLCVRSDPMSVRAAAFVAATVPLACALTCLAIPCPLADPNQLNALGCGVAMCAFMCMRGRTVAAWVAFVAMVAVVTSWSIITGQELYGLWMSLPNAAVVCMATLFAVVVRPAVTAIRELNAESIHQAQTMAAANARLAERDERRAELRRVAWPILRCVAAGQGFSSRRVHDVRLAEAQLRDSVRARSLNLPLIVEAVRGARSRGVHVVMFDDGALKQADDGSHAAYCRLVVDSLRRAHDGSVTIRIHPPDRQVAASIVSVREDGTSERIDLDDAGRTLDP